MYSSFITISHVCSHISFVIVRVRSATSLTRSIIYKNRWVGVVIADGQRKTFPAQWDPKLGIHVT